MPRVSAKKNKNPYHQTREDRGLSREKAYELSRIPVYRLKEFEIHDDIPTPLEAARIAEAYQAPELLDYYCSHDWLAKHREQRPVRDLSLAEITLMILSSLSMINSQKDRLIEITADGKVGQKEMSDFLEIKRELEGITCTVDSLKAWVEKELKNGPER